MIITEKALLDCLDDIRARVAVGDSFEGRLSYELVGPGEWDISGAYRIGNENGQGGWSILEETPDPMCQECGVNFADPPSKLCPGCEAYQAHQR